MSPLLRKASIKIIISKAFTLSLSLSFSLCPNQGEIRLVKHVRAAELLGHSHHSDKAIYRARRYSDQGAYRAKHYSDQGDTIRVSRLLGHRRSRAARYSDRKKRS